MLIAVFILIIILFVWVDRMDSRRHQATVERLSELNLRLRKLEFSKPPTSQASIEIKDAIKSVREEQENIRDLVNEVVTNVNTTALRLIATFKPEKRKKEMSQ